MMQMTLSYFIARMARKKIFLIVYQTTFFLMGSMDVMEWIKHDEKLTRAKLSSRERVKQL